MKTEFVVLGKHINVASRARRRWLVALLYGGFGGLVIAWCSVYGQSFAGFVIFLAIAAAARFLGGRTYEEGLIPPAESGDERERHRRDRAYYVAYKWWDLTLIPANGGRGAEEQCVLSGGGIGRFGCSLTVCRLGC